MNRRPGWALSWKLCLPGMIKVRCCRLQHCAACTHIQHIKNLIKNPILLPMRRCARHNPKLLPVYPNTRSISLQPTSTKEQHRGTCAAHVKDPHPSTAGVK